MSLYFLTVMFLVLKGTGTDEEPKPPEIAYKEFGEIVVKGEKFTKDIVIEGGKVRKRKKGPSKDEKAKYGHTPLTPKEKIPWECKTLVVGTGMYGKLPVVKEFEEEASRRQGIRGGSKAARREACHSQDQGSGEVLPGELRTGPQCHLSHHLLICVWGSIDSGSNQP
jgi:hypothetical protein